MQKLPKKKDEDTPELKKLTPEELEELKRTESEVEIKKKEFICVVHKGYVEGDMYLCPICHTIYCDKCAKALKLKGDRCWSCDSKLTVSISLGTDFSEESLTTALEDVLKKDLSEDIAKIVDSIESKIAKAEEAIDNRDFKKSLKYYEDAIVLALKAGEDKIAKGLTAKMPELKKLIIKEEEAKKEYKKEHEMELKVFKASVKSIKKLLKEPKEKEEDVTDKVLRVSADIMKDVKKKKKKD